MIISRLETFMQRVGDRPRLLVKITTDDGIAGWAEAYNHGPDRALVPLLEYLFAQIEGVDARRVTYVNQYLLQSSRFPPGALGLAAIAAIDHALWDIAGKAAGLPVYQLLGGAVRDRVRVYAGLYSAPDVPQLADRAGELHERYGFTAFKLSPYRSDIHATRWGTVCRETGDWFAEIRERLPDAWEFAFDAHACIWEPGQAVQLAAALAPNEPLFLEEPIRPEHVPAWARIRSEMLVPLATGESLYTPNEFLALLTADGADIVQPDICVVGGLTQMRKIAVLAEAHYVARRPAQPDGPARHGREPALRGGHHQLRHPGVQAGRHDLVRRPVSAGGRAPASCAPTGRAGAWRSTSRRSHTTTTSTGSGGCRGARTGRPRTCEQ